MINKLIRITIFVLILLSLLTTTLISQNKELELYPIKAKIMHGHECDIDPEEGGFLLLENINASSCLKDDTGINYSIEKAIKGTIKEAWCVKGDGAGEWMRADIPLNQLMQEGMANVYRILILNGLGANKNLYYANNRVKKIRVDFSEGQRRILNLKDGEMELQRFVIHIKSKWIKLTILETYKGSKYNDTCIGKLIFETTDHPDDKKK